MSTWGVASGEIGAAHLVLKMVLIFYGGYAHVGIASYAGENHYQCSKRNKLGMIKIWASHIHPTAPYKFLYVCMCSGDGSIELVLFVYL